MTGGGDGWSIQVAISTRQVIPEERFARLEVEVRAGSATSTDGFRTLPDGLSASFERIINDHELFVFGSKVPSENCTEIL